jgi:cob(I)alamin adenosyltransferase
MRKGLLVVFTGNGKGKTTAALGCALRALGHGCKVCMIQFVKGAWKSGELNAVKRFEDLMKVYTLGKGFMFSEEEVQQNIESAREAWQFAKKIIGSSEYDIVILDELTYLMYYKIIDKQDVMSAILHRPPELHLIVTGRHASDEIVEAADLVTEMKEIKHPLNNGIKCQKGIEF